MPEVLRAFKCSQCGHGWAVPFGGGRQIACPKCGSAKIKRANPVLASLSPPFVLNSVSP